MFIYPTLNHVDTMWKLCFNVSLLRMVPDLETGGMIGLMSSTSPGLVTEIKDPRQLLLPDVNHLVELLLQIYLC